MNVLIDIPDVSLCLIKNGSPMCDILLNCIKDGYFIPDDITNGGLVQIMFPNGDLHDYDYYDGYVIYELNYMDMKFDKDWWYAPYKKGGQNEET